MNSNWKECKLGDVSSYVNRGISPSYVDNDGLAVLNQKCIRNGMIDFEPSRLTSKNKKIPLEKMLQQCDILINSTGVGTAGRVAILKEDTKTTVDSHVSIVRINKGVAEPKYIFYSLFGIESDIETFAEGSTGQIELGRERIRELPVLLPPLPEQRAIAGVLSSLDDKIVLLHRQNKTLEGMAAVLWRQMFVEEADPTWKKVNMSEIIEVRDGTHDSPKQTENGFYLITSRHLKEEGIDYANAYKISEQDYNQINRRSKVDKNDLLFSMIGTLGLIHYVDEGPSFAIKNIGLFKSSKKPEFAKYLYLLLKSPIGKDFIFENADGSTQEYIALGNLRSLAFEYPGDLIIKKFDVIIEPYFNKIYRNKRQIRTLSRLRDTLLPKLMSGEVRVKL